MKIFAVSLGCPKNGVDTEVAISSIKNVFDSIEIVKEPELAQIILVNTCGFIKSSVLESIETILSLAKRKKKSQKIVAIGCMVERYSPSALKKELPEVDLFLGANIYDSVGYEIQKNLFKGSINNENKVFNKHPLRLFNSVTPPWRAYIKIAEGCSNACAYCLIPKIRGKLSCVSPEKILAEIKELEKKDVKEITLVAQDLTAYKYDDFNLERLLEKIAHKSQIPWIRLLYLHPKRLSKKLIDIIKNNKNICPYFDAPIQHASDRILKKMGRKYTLEHLKGLFSYIRDYFPDASIRTTVMTGFPGETNEDFEILKEFISTMEFDHLGVFTYSDEEEAPSYNFRDKASEKEALRRKKEILRIQKTISKKRLKRWRNQTVDALIEGKSAESESLYYGRTTHQAPDIDGVVYISGDIKKIGEIVPVRINETHVYDMAGEIIR